METMEISTWSDFKSLVTAKALSLQYVDVDNYYSVFAPEAQAFMWHFNVIKGTADATDFETHYKSTANAPLEIKAGTGRPERFSMSPQPLGTYNKWKGYQAVLNPGMTYTFIDVSWSNEVYFRGGCFYTNAVDADDYLNVDVLLAGTDQIYMPGMIKNVYLASSMMIPFESDESMAFPPYLKLRVHFYCPDGLSETETRHFNIITEYFE